MWDLEFCLKYKHTQWWSWIIPESCSDINVLITWGEFFKHRRGETKVCLGVQAAFILSVFIEWCANPELNCVFVKQTIQKLFVGHLIWRISQYKITKFMKCLMNHSSLNLSLWFCKNNVSLGDNILVKLFTGQVTHLIFVRRWAAFSLQMSTNLCLYSSQGRKFNFIIGGQ